jgi:hypothetical protein
VPEGSAEPPARDLTNAVLSAKSGLLRDVVVLVDALDVAERLVPLARDVPDAAEGVRTELPDELTLVPHLLWDEDGKAYAALFTRADFLEPLEQTLGWKTGDGPLKYCALPAKLAFELALQIIDQESIPALVLNALDDSELVLSRLELASIRQGRALPLVGYVKQIPEQETQRTLIAEPGEPEPAALLRALEAWVAAQPDVQAFQLYRSFNPDRDLEPHLTLKLRLTRPDADRTELAGSAFSAIERELPPPGYVDVLFDEPSRAAEPEEKL